VKTVYAIKTDPLVLGGLGLNKNMTKSISKKKWLKERRLTYFVALPGKLKLTMKLSERSFSVSISETLILVSLKCDT
jgi:hypothetical protein